MSAKDQILSAKLQGEALLIAQRPELEALMADLREIAVGRDDIRVACAGTIAGSWFASPGGHRGLADAEDASATGA